MSLMNWLFPAKQRSRSAPSSGTSAGSRKESSGDGSSSAKRKSGRSARRELLYAVIREAMVRAGVLSASYKFKVLSLDASGRQYLAMIDVAREAGGDSARFTGIEALIMQAAKSRHDLVVTAVYWRLGEHVGAGAAASKQASSHSQPMPLESQPAPLHSGPVPLAGGRSGHDPIQAEEVEAFKKALVAGSTGPMPLAVLPTAGAKAASRPGPRSYTLLTGYEDTEMPETDHKAPLLSGTQYGDLR
jgi:hypothetical protein